METKSYCPVCDKEMNQGGYERGDGEYVCQDCYESMVDAAVAQGEGER